MKKKYMALRAVAGYIEVIAYLELIFGIILAIFFVYKATQFNSDQINIFSLIPGIAIIVSSIIACIIMLALAQIIRVFIDIEENTRIIINQTVSKEDLEKQEKMRGEENENLERQNKIKEEAKAKRKIVGSKKECPHCEKLIPIGACLCMYCKKDVD